MKKVLMAALMIATFVTSAFANPVKVNQLALKNFSAEFKDASEVTWFSTTQFYKAVFVSEGQRMEAFYSPTGEKIGTSRGISLDELPLKAKRAFVKKFEGYDVKEAILFEGTDDDSYYISAENKAENVIVRVFDNGDVSVFKRTKK